jgi:hypothetical protein
MRAIRPLGLLLAASACTSGLPDEPSLADVSGFATVFGHVYDAAGAPIAAAPVAISCASGAFSYSVPADSVGRYSLNLAAPARVLGGPSGSLTCLFSVSEGGPPRISRDVVIGFARAGLPHAMQFVDLREAP